MANTILLKRNSTAAAQPTAGQLSAGELAINTADGRLFAKNSAGSVVNLPVSSIAGQSIAPGQVDVDNIRLDVNTISSTDTNGNLIVSPNGTGKVLLGRTTADGTTNVVQVNSLTINGSDTIGNGVTPSFAAKGSTFFSSADGSVGIGGWIIPEDTFDTHPNAFGYTGLNEAVTQYTPLCFTAQYGAQLWLSTNGNVGIGTAAPSAKLHVAGESYFEGNMNVDAGGAGSISCMYLNAGTSIGGFVTTDTFNVNQTITNVNIGMGSISFLDSGAYASFLLDAEYALTLYSYSGASSSPEGPGASLPIFSTDRGSGTINMWRASVTEGGIVSPGNSLYPGIQSPQTGLFLWQYFR